MYQDGGMKRLLSKVLVQAGREAAGVKGKGATGSFQPDAVDFLQSDWAEEIADYLDPDLSKRVMEYAAARRHNGVRQGRLF